MVPWIYQPQQSNRVADCLCMCVSASVKVGTNLPKNMCHHMFDWAQQEIKNLAEEPVACWESNRCVLFICLASSDPAAGQLPRSIQPHMSSFLFIPSVFHLLNPTPSPISRSEIKSKHRGDSQSHHRRQNRCWLKLASGWNSTPSLFSLIKCVHCVNRQTWTPLLSPATTLSLSCLYALTQCLHKPWTCENS